MEISYDRAKNERNIRLRGLSFDAVSHFDFATAMVIEDIRQDYGETRWRALGLIDHRLYALVFTTTQHGIRIISFRKANSREAKHYEQATRP